MPFSMDDRTEHCTVPAHGWNAGFKIMHIEPSPGQCGHGHLHPNSCSALGDGVDDDENGNDDDL